VALRCPGELTKDLMLNVRAKDLTFKAKDSKFVLENISRPRTKAKGNNTDTSLDSQ